MIRVKLDEVRDVPIDFSTVRREYQPLRLALCDGVRPGAPLRRRVVHIAHALDLRWSEEPRPRNPAPGRRIMTTPICDASRLIALLRERS
jgi:hypothetical protein